MEGGPRQSEVEPGAPASTLAAAALDYAPTDRRRQRRRWLKRLTYVGVACALLLASWRWGLPAARQAAVLHWQRQCLAYDGPPEAVVYETDPQVVPRLLRRGYGS